MKKLILLILISAFSAAAQQEETPKYTGIPSWALYLFFPEGSADTGAQGSAACPGTCGPSQKKA
jgi:hypothetical protein